MRWVCQLHRLHYAILSRNIYVFFYPHCAILHTLHIALTSPGEQLSPRLQSGVAVSRFFLVYQLLFRVAVPLEPYLQG